MQVEILHSVFEKVFIVRCVYNLEVIYDFLLL